MADNDHGKPERGIVIHRIMKKVTSNAKFPVLTKTNYLDWATLMHVMLQARGLWIVVSMGTDDYTKDRMALEVIAKVVPAEMMGSIATKAMAKIAWDVIRTMYIGVEWVRKAKAGTLWREFDALRFKDGESLDDFFIRINMIVHELAVSQRRVHGGGAHLHDSDGAPGEVPPDRRRHRDPAQSERNVHGGVVRAPQVVGGKVQPRWFHCRAQPHGGRARRVRRRQNAGLR
jgi:hypothetical protein